MNIIFTLGVFLLLILGFFHPVTSLSQDLGRHLLTGKIIVETGTIPKTNLFSYTYPDFPFINHHWLSEVLFYLIVKLANFQGLLVLSIVLTMTSFFLVFRSASKKSSIIPLTIISILYLRVLFERTDIRPELFSFLLLSIFITILFKFKEKFTRLIFLLPLLELLWVNIHIYFFVGLILIALFLLDALHSNIKNLSSKQIVTLLFILLLSFLSILFNPNGLTGAFYPLRVFQNYGYSIEENQNLFFLFSLFTKQTIIYFWVGAAILFTSLLFSFKKSRLIDWLLAICFITLTVVAERNFPLFVFATFIPAVYSLNIVYKKLSLSPAKQNLVSVAVLLFLLWQLITIFSLKPLGFGVEIGAQKGVDFLVRHQVKGPILNNFDIGSYLEYRLYPREKVFVDGRPEAYPASFFQETYIPMQQDKTVFEKADKKYHFNTIFFTHSDQTPWAHEFLKQIVLSPSWKIVFLDDYVVILVKNEQKNKDLIASFVVTKETLRIENALSKDPLSLYRLSNFLDTVGWIDQEQAIYERIVSKDPTLCPALYNLALILNQKHSPVANVYASRFHATCK